MVNMRVCDSSPVLVTFCYIAYPCPSKLTSYLSLSAAYLKSKLVHLANKFVGLTCFSRRLKYIRAYAFLEIFTSSFRDTHCNGYKVTDFESLSCGHKYLRHSVSKYFGEARV